MTSLSADKVERLGFYNLQELLEDDNESMAGTMEVSDHDDQSGTDYFELLKDFDARSAIIYSAIINRIDI